MKSFMELKCPRCGADLDVEEDREILYCKYCGAKIIMTDENTFTINKTIRTIDDADITRAETDRIVQMHKIEIDKQNSKRDAVMQAIKVFSSFFLGLAAICYSNTPRLSFMCVVGIILIWNIKYVFRR